MNTDADIKQEKSQQAKADLATAHEVEERKVHVWWNFWRGFGIAFALLVAVLNAACAADLGWSWWIGMLIGAFALFVGLCIEEAIVHCRRTPRQKHRSQSVLWFAATAGLVAVALTLSRVFRGDDPSMAAQSLVWAICELAVSAVIGLCAAKQHYGWLRTDELAKRSRRFYETTKNDLSPERTWNTEYFSARDDCRKEEAKTGDAKDSLMVEWLDGYMKDIRRACPDPAWISVIPHAISILAPEELTVADLEENGLDSTRPPA